MERAEVRLAEARRTLDLEGEEAALALASGANVVLATPTGSGKSLVAVAAHAQALAAGERSWYTAPIKALVSEKFFALCEIFGPANVGMLTGDASVNADAPVICCTAEVLANIALREGAEADVGLVVMDEFHFYAEPDRGWAWQVPLLELPQAQFDTVFGLWKYNPLADWRETRIWQVVRALDIPYNPLHDQGYPSIGCEPCTRAIRPGEDTRAGRWWWEQKQSKECGLHAGLAATEIGNGHG